ncbi:MAG: PEP-CTERM sorting domain-containing protein [Akkermansiaceae bacterium]|nr:PEP-CTERM sorting domain-containing protein [Akkermansiaceae bacterium]
MKLTCKFLFILSTLAMTAQAEPVFVDGVSMETGWYDCNKKQKWSWQAFPPSYYNKEVFPDDLSMCWAHAASNVLQWWQDAQAPSLIPATAPNGKSDTAVSFYATVPDKVGSQRIDDPLYVQQLAIYKDIAKNWENTGGKVMQAYNWYFNGGKLDTIEGTLKNPNSGGYYADLGLVMTGNTSPLFTSFTFNDSFTRAEIIDTLVRFIDNNYGTTLSLASKEGGHAVTMWGYEQVGEDFFVYLTDSDDAQHALIKQKVVFSDTKWAYLTACDGDTPVYTEQWVTDLYGYANITINGVEQEIQGIMLSEAQAFMAPRLSIPEPASATLSLLALCGLAARRRR